MREEDKRKKERGKKEKARAAEKRWKRGTGRRRVFPRQRALIPLDVSQRVANIDLRGTSTLFNPRRRCFICLLVALSSAFLHHHHPQRHTLAEFLSVSLRLSFPYRFSLSYISSFVCERLPQTNWIRRASQSYRITLTAEKCRSRWRILAERSRSHNVGNDFREWKRSSCEREAFEGEFVRSARQFLTGEGFSSRSDGHL